VANSRLWPAGVHEGQAKTSLGTAAKEQIARETWREEDTQTHNCTYFPTRVTRFSRVTKDWGLGFEVVGGMFFSILAKILN